jgi:hypothetical protein
MRMRQKFAHDLRGSACVDEIVDDEHLAGRPRENLLRQGFQHRDLAALGFLMVARDANRIDHSDAEFARDDARRNHAAARHRRYGRKAPYGGEARGERSRVLMKRIP